MAASLNCRLPRRLAEPTDHAALRSTDCVARKRSWRGLGRWRSDDCVILGGVRDCGVLPNSPTGPLWASRAVATKVQYSPDESTMKRIASGCLVATGVCTILAIVVGVHRERSIHANTEAHVDGVLRLVKVPRTESVELIEHIDSYATGLVIPPGGADGTREIVLRIPVEEAQRVLSNPPPDRFRAWQTQIPPGLPAWKTLEDWFRPSAESNHELHCAIWVRGQHGRRRISNCSLIIVDPQRGLLGYYRFDM